MCISESCLGRYFQHLSVNGDRLKYDLGAAAAEANQCRDLLSQAQYHVVRARKQDDEEKALRRKQDEERQALKQKVVEEQMKREERRRQLLEEKVCGYQWSDTFFTQMFKELLVFFFIQVLKCKTCINVHVILKDRPVSVEHQCKTVLY